MGGAGSVGGRPIKQEVVAAHRPPVRGDGACMGVAAIAGRGGGGQIYSQDLPVRQGVWGKGERQGRLKS